MCSEYLDIIRTSPNTPQDHPQTLSEKFEKKVGQVWCHFFTGYVAICCYLMNYRSNRAQIGANRFSICDIVGEEHICRYNQYVYHGLIGV